HFPTPAARPPRLPSAHKHGQPKTLTLFSTSAPKTSSSNPHPSPVDFLSSNAIFTRPLPIVTQRASISLITTRATPTMDGSWATTATSLYAQHLGPELNLLRADEKRIIDRMTDSDPENLLSGHVLYRHLNQDLKRLIPIIQSYTSLQAAIAEIPNLRDYMPDFCDLAALYALKGSWTLKIKNFLTQARMAHFPCRPDAVGIDPWWAGRFHEMIGYPGCGDPKPPHSVRKALTAITRAGDLAVSRKRPHVDETQPSATDAVSINDGQSATPNNQAAAHKRPQIEMAQQPHAWQAQSATTESTVQQSQTEDSHQTPTKSLFQHLQPAASTIQPPSPTPASYGRPTYDTPFGNGMHHFYQSLAPSFHDQPFGISQPALPPSNAYLPMSRTQPAPSIEEPTRQSDIDKLKTEVESLRKANEVLKKNEANHKRQIDDLKKETEADLRHKIDNLKKKIKEAFDMKQGLSDEINSALKAENKAKEALQEMAQIDSKLPVQTSINPYRFDPNRRVGYLGNEPPMPYTAGGVDGTHHAEVQYDNPINPAARPPESIPPTGAKPARAATSKQARPSGHKHFRPQRRNSTTLTVFESPQ
ncbi:hypothetical protein B0T19DRAFT_454572, partial [Cercophora scortea]